jgi:hypothetical protein
VLLAVAATAASVAVSPAPASAAGCGLLGLFNCPAPAPPPGPAPPPPPPESVTAHPGTPVIPKRPDGKLPMGFDDHSTLAPAPQASYAENGLLHRGVGSTVRRVPLEWAQIEGVRGNFIWWYYDNLYQQTLANGQRPLFTLVFVPAWAVNNPVRCSAPPGASCQMPPAYEYYGDFANFAAKVAQRYPQAVGLEVWNEPNLAMFWRDYHPTNPKLPDPGTYATLVKWVYAAVKRANPSMPVIAGSVNNTSASVNGDISERQFINGMYASGIKGNMDALSIHPYPVFKDPAKNQFKRSLDDARVNINKWNDAGRRLWLTELGAPMNGDSGSDVVGEAAQRDLMIDTYRRANAEPDIDLLIFQSLINQPNQHWGFGWVLPRDVAGYFRPREVYCAFAAELSVPGTCGPMRAS